MLVLGLNHGEINSSAVLARDGRVVAGAPEERFNRQKRTKAFPAKAIRFCLDNAGIEIGQCDSIAQAWNPGACWLKFNPLVSGARVRREDYFYAVPDHLFELAPRQPSDWVRMDFDQGALPEIYYVQHHLCHAANAFYLSPFEDGAILTCDFKGEFECTTMSMGRGSAIERISSQTVPNSLGMFYATFTELLGYEPDGDEWKVMALSAFDVDCSKIERALRATVKLNDDGTISLDQNYYKGALVDQPNLYTDRLRQLVGGRVGVPGEEAGEWHFTIARAMQRISEDMATHLARHLHKCTKSSRIALSGGFFMNSVFNGKVLDVTPFKEMFVSYAPADVGNSIGAALYVTHAVKRQPRSTRYNPSEIGPAYDDAAIERAMRRRHLPFRRVNDVAQEVAEYLDSGQVVAVFAGPAEFGERALGNRSILADPRHAGMKDRINELIKYREGYRPFAPAVTRERCATYFEVPEHFEAPYMEKVVPVRHQFRTALPAITHVDGSARVQTVTRDSNPHFYEIIDRFGKISSFPVVLNTSFNINGEPIVLTPDDALTTFFNSGLDVLAIGNFIVTKQLQ